MLCHFHSEFAYYFSIALSLQRQVLLNGGHGLEKKGALICMFSISSFIAGLMKELAALEKI